MKISVVCMGNICRSPIGEVVLRQRAAQRGLDIEVCSGGTGPWHLGDAAHPQSLKVMAEAGYDGRGHHARQITASWFADHDLILVMDRTNLNAVRALAPNDDERSKVRLFRDYDPQADAGSEVPDPYGLGLDDYRLVLSMIEQSVEGFLSQFERNLR